MDAITLLSKYWQELYGNQNNQLLEDFILEMNSVKKQISIEQHQAEWYKDAVIYSLYVDLFNTNFNGLEEKLDYLQDLGVNCLWLLPVLDSPMKDAGFDIRNYDQIREELLGLPASSSKEEKQIAFRKFLDHAHSKGIKVIFDVAINHTSDEHPWFIESRKSVDNPYRDYYIWSQDTRLYKEARIIFKGLCESNWEKDGDWNYFHRFFEFQPDLNYKNPKVLIEMSKNFLFWLSQGVDGFRADAIPYLWKEEGTTCENHPTTHTVVKFFRAVIEYIRPHTLLLAEACQKPLEVVKYFGDGDECNAGYHFPLMPQMFKAIAAQSKEPITKTLDLSVTPDIPDSAQWLTFLRCHDELSLELVYVTEEDRKYIHDKYCHQPEWDFRLGQGISSRLSELMKQDPQKIGLAFSIMLSLPGTPIIYYGDEFGKLNDHSYYKEMIKMTGKDDTRFLVRGKIDWKKVETELGNEKNFSGKVYSRVKNLVNTRNRFKCFGRGSIEWLDIYEADNKIKNEVLSYIRQYKNERILILNNLSEKEIIIHSRQLAPYKQTHLLQPDLTMNPAGDITVLNPFGYYWIKLD
jgi:maltose alpha-D-glucosyltransferase/alpha-amylase